MNEVDGLIDTLLTATASPSPYAIGTIVSFVTDGANPYKVTVRWQGALVPALCSREVTPVVGRTAIMQRIGPQLFISNTY